MDNKLQAVNCKQLQLLTGTEVLDYFIDLPQLTYKSAQKDTLLHRRSSNAYHDAVKTLETFIDTILRQEVLIKHLDYAGAVLYLPDRPLKVSVTITDDNPLGIGQENGVKTAFGIFDEYTWEMISLFGMDSPVWLFYQYMLDNIKFLREELFTSNADLANAPMNKALLQEYQIQEVVGIHNMLCLQYKLQAALLHI